MTYEAEVQFKFDATYTHDYNRGFASHLGDEDFLPEEHYLVTAPAGDLNCRQYFKLFEKFMLCVGMDPKSIRSGAMSLVFNDMVREEDQRKVCKEYELTMDEDLEKKYQEYKERDAEWTKMNIHYKKTFGSDPKIKDDWEPMTDEESKDHPSWEERYWAIYRRFQRFAVYSDDQLNEMLDAYDRVVNAHKIVDSADGVS
jgi:hypothetical protein